MPIIILTDRRRLIQLILTLLSNAHSHTNTGQIILRILFPCIAGMISSEYLRFQIEDTGEGIDSIKKGRLKKYFNSGIEYSDLISISSFGFNLLICNIIAKKLFNQSYSD